MTKLTFDPSPTTAVNGWAIAGFVGGIVALVALLLSFAMPAVFIGSVAIVLGIVGLAKARRGAGLVGLAVAAIAIGAIPVGMAALFFFGAAFGR